MNDSNKKEASETGKKGAGARPDPKFATQEQKKLHVKLKRFSTHLANYRPGNSKSLDEADQALSNFMGFEASSMRRGIGIKYNTFSSALEDNPGETKGKGKKDGNYKGKKPRV